MSDNNPFRTQQPAAPSDAERRAAWPETPASAKKSRAASSGGNGGGGGGNLLWRAAKGLLTVIVIMFAGVGLFIVAGLFSLFSSLSDIDTPVAPTMPNEITLSYALNKSPAETNVGGGFASLLTSDQTVPQFVRALDAAAKDDRVKGLIFRIEPMHMSLAHAQEMRDAIIRFREAGKFAHVFSFSMGDFIGGTGPYYLASAFDEIWIQPAGSIALTGIGTELPFAADLLARFNVKFEAITREEYKSLMAQYTESSMPPAQREAMEALINDMYEQLVDDIAADRGLPAETVMGLIDRAPLTAQEALEAGLIDRIGYRDDFLDEAPEKIVSLTRYAAQIEQPSVKANGIALVQAAGPIMQGVDGEAALFSGNMRTSYINEVMEQIIDDPAIEAVVFRLDSPGGSPAASEFVRRALKRVSEAGKPVIVSMGRVAASGGYWIASGGDAIIAQPGTLTGSIGVVAGKPNLQDFWQEWDVSWAQIYRGENADMISPNEPFDAAGREAINRSMDAIYQDFLARVAESRGFSVEEARELAKGRVWSGRQAYQVGLVDELGGIDKAFARAASAAGIDEGDATLLVYPRPTSRFETVIDLVKNIGSIYEGLQILSELSVVAEKTGIRNVLELARDPSMNQTPEILTR